MTLDEFQTETLATLADNDALMMIIDYYSTYNALLTLLKDYIIFTSLRDLFNNSKWTCLY